MTTELASEMMTTEEAHAAADEIRKLTQSFARDLGRLRALALDFHGRKGWAALGYNTIEACAKNEFGWKRSQFYRQLTAGKIEESAGIPVGSSPERSVRVVVKGTQQRLPQGNDSLPESCDVPNNSTEVQREAFAEASANGPVTAEKVRRAVERIEQPARDLMDLPAAEDEAADPMPLPMDRHAAQLETQAVPTDWQVVSAQAPQQSEPEPFPLDPLPDDPAEVERLKAETRRVVEEAWDEYKPEPEKITPSGVTGEDWARVEYAPAPASDLGEIEAAVLKRNKISVGQAAGYFAQIIAAAEQGGPSWEMRLRIAARPNPK